MLVYTHNFDFEIYFSFQLPFHTYITSIYTGRALIKVLKLLNINININISIFTATRNVIFE